MLLKSEFDKENTLLRSNRESTSKLAVIFTLEYKRLQPFFFTDLGKLATKQLEEIRAYSFLIQHVAVEV